MRVTLFVILFENIKYNSKILFEAKSSIGIDEDRVLIVNLSLNFMEICCWCGEGLVVDSKRTKFE